MIRHSDGKVTGNTADLAMAFHVVGPRSFKEPSFAQRG